MTNNETKKKSRMPLCGTRNRIHRYYKWGLRSGMTEAFERVCGKHRRWKWKTMHRTMAKNMNLNFEYVFVYWGLRNEKKTAASIDIRTFSNIVFRRRISLKDMWHYSVILKLNLNVCFPKHGSIYWCFNEATHFPRIF